MTYYQDALLNSCWPVGEARSGVANDARDERTCISCDFSFVKCFCGPVALLFAPGSDDRHVMCF